MGARGSSRRAARAPARRSSPAEQPAGGGARLGTRPGGHGGHHGDDAWGLGTIAGLVHAAVVGLVFMPMMPGMHPRMEHTLVGAGAPAEGGTVAIDDRGEVRLSAPGPLGEGWGGMTPIGMLMGHAVDGVVAALVYGWVS